MSNFSNEQQTGTGFMVSPTEALKVLAGRGYTENLGLRFDHLELHDGRERFGAEDFTVDEIIRFENNTDPDDQSILYAISFNGRKGTVLESYGPASEEHSEPLMKKLGGRQSPPADNIGKVSGMASEQAIL